MSLALLHAFPGDKKQEETCGSFERIWKVCALLFYVYLSKINVATAIKFVSMEKKLL